jgi:hypothetical protein
LRPLQLPVVAAAPIIERKIMQMETLSVPPALNVFYFSVAKEATLDTMVVRAANVMVGAATGTVTAIATVIIAIVMEADVIVIADHSLFNN